MDEKLSIPIVMVFAGNDPTGGAGIQADIESLASMGCHTAPVITALTVQDTGRFLNFQATPAPLLIEQARAVLEDSEVAAIKIGMLASVENVEAIHTILKDYPSIPVVLDPILRSGSGAELATAALAEAMRALLFPEVAVLTPNSLEARWLAPGADTLEASGQMLLELGPELVLITGTHEKTPQVINALYGNHRLIDRFAWERLPGTYHGSGCTLASAVAGLLAQGNEPFSAIYEAQQYTWEALRHAYRTGMGQLIPNRLFWALHSEGTDA